MCLKIISQIAIALEVDKYLGRKILVVVIIIFVVVVVAVHRVGRGLRRRDGGPGGGGRCRLRHPLIREVGLR